MARSSARTKVRKAEKVAACLEPKVRMAYPVGLVMVADRPVMRIFGVGQSRRLLAEKALELVQRARRPLVDADHTAGLVPLDGRDDLVDHRSQVLVHCLVLRHRCRPFLVATACPPRGSPTAIDALHRSITGATGRKGAGRWRFPVAPGILAMRGPVCRTTAWGHACGHDASEAGPRGGLDERPEE